MSKQITVVIRSVRSSSGIPVVHYQCDYLHKGGHLDPTKGSIAVPQEDQPLLYAATEAAKELDCDLQVIDLNKVGIFQRLKGMISGKPLPRIEIGDRTLDVTSKKIDVIEAYRTEFS
jgi:hypothetical protein